MRAVRCHRFACVEPKSKPAQKQQQQQQRPSFRPRKSQLRLRDCLSLDDVPYPTLSMKATANEDETTIVIRTEYAGIQYPDALQAQGLYQVKPQLPYTPGMDVVGIVLEVVPPSASTSRRTKNPAPPAGTSSRIRPGDRVMATLMDSGGTGGLSEVVLAPLKHVYKLPPLAIARASGAADSVSASVAFANAGRNTWVGAAAFANVGRNYFAAYHSLVEVGHIDPTATATATATARTSKEHQTIVLVTGASGGVGMATIELAKAMGCTVVAGVGTPSKMSGPESVGADAVFCYGRTKPERKAFRKEVTAFCQQRQQQQQQHKRGVDLVVDMVMGDLFDDALLGCLKPLGTIALVGFAAGQRKIRPGLLLVKEARVAGSLWGSVAVEASEDENEDENDAHTNKYRTMVERILGYLADGSIKGRVDRIVPVSRFLEAFEVFEENKGRGNTVVSFVDDNDNENDGNRRRSRL